MSKFKLVVVILSFVLATIAVSFVGYYFLVILPSQAEAKLLLEKQKFEAEQKEKEEEKIAEDSAKAEAIAAQQAKEADLNQCLYEAEWNYAQSWAAACVEQSAQSISKNKRNLEKYNECLDQPYRTESICKNLYLSINWDESDAEDCTLYGGVGQNIAENKDKAKEECFKLYK